MHSTPEEKSQEPVRDPEAIVSELHAVQEKLKILQSQLVESEKMATLGQLTAGIAHEIKNPLNFINNFSELSLDLVNELDDEMKGYLATLPEKDAGNIRDILNDLRDNLGKINDHGKRADSIIRGMLLHSRGNAAEMIPTRINNLLAEYVNLAYHGMRATDNSFNIKIESEYDPATGSIPAIPQDLSRVFLNILNNAFYSTNEKKKEQKDAYAPVLSVSTKDLDKQVEIRLRDNGKGIPKAVMEKIFNAFYTTKPAGLGTGLGLSISQDIIVREHRGEIRVESVEGEWAEFIIKLPKE